MACYHPIVIKSPYNEKAYISVPCGKCSGCRKSMQNNWFIRFIEENKQTSCRFVTLTYDEESIPYHFDKYGCVHYDVSKEDLQKFFKRMRKQHKFKYFAVSEYGSETHRPHYHLLLFSNENIQIDKFWRFGYVVNLPASKGSFKYVTKYILKGCNVPKGSLKNFMCCSKRPAIGLNFIKDNDSFIDRKLSDETYRLNDLIYPLPRYYRKKLYEKLNDGGENNKRLKVEELETKMHNSDMYREFLKNHDPDKEDFFEWLNYLDKKNTNIQSKIKLNHE